MIRPFQQDDIFRSTHVVDGALTPDGRYAVYQLAETVPGKTKDEDKPSSSLWRVSLDGGEPRRLTPKGVSASNLRLTPDGEAVLFLSARAPTSEIPQIYRLPLNGGEAEALTSLEQGVTAFALSPDGKWIAFSALEKAPKPPGPNDHVRITRKAYRLDSAPGYLQDLMQALHVMPAEGGESKALTAHDGIFANLAWSPDSREIAAGVIAREAHGDFAMLGDIVVLGREGGETTLLGKAVVLSLFWSNDGKIGFIGNPGGNLSRQFQLWVLDRAGGAPVCRTQKLDLSVGGLVETHSPGGFAMPRLQSSADGKTVFAPITKGGETSIYQVALSGPESAEPLVKGHRMARPLDVVGSTLLFCAQDFNTPSELYAYDLGSGRERALTTHNASWRSEIAWPEYERITVTSAPGVEIEGWVIKPPHVKPPYKTILTIHGGPHAGFGYGYSEDYQELLGAGYAIAFCNPRGSTGYGDAFSASIIGRWGDPELEDFNAFLDELVKRGISDPNRLGVTGGSGGGHLSGWLIGHTDRFKAAVPEQGVYSMVSMYGTSDAGVDLIALEMGGEPHEQGAVQIYWDRSPIAHAHKATTPTLLIQGENDIRCPMEQAEQFYTILRHHGCKAELLRLRNCNHGAQVVGQPALRRFRNDAIRDWFDRHIV